MALRLRDDDLDRLAPFGVLLDEDLVVRRQGPSWVRLGVELVGRPMREVLEVARPLGVETLDDIRRHRDSMLLLRVLPEGPRMRFQAVDVEDPSGVLLLGNPIIGSSRELEELGLSAADFSPIDQTPDLLFLRRGQERSLDDLRTLNAELQRSATELREANRLLTRAEAQYRRIVERQPLVMYVDSLGENARSEFVSPQVVEWLGYPIRRWLSEPGFFFDTVVHPDDLDAAWAAHLLAEEVAGPYDHEMRLVTADGRVVWTRAVDSVIEDDDGHRARLGFMLDITTAKEAELELRDTMSRLTTLLDHMQSGVLVEDSQRRVVMANETLCRMFRSDVDPASLVGLPMSAAVAAIVRTEDEPAQFLRRAEDLTSRGWATPNQSLNLSGSRVLEFDYQPIVAADRQHLGALWMFRDATDRVLYQEALARARDEAIAASDAKSQFLASMSHEIRTPMHGVLATVDLLRMTDLDDEQAELVRVIDTSANSLVSIINDILDLQKVEAGRIDLVSEPFSVAETAQAVTDLLRPQARAKGVDLVLDTDPDVPESVLGDRVRFRQVLVNLVGNAVKFTESGAVSLRLAQVGRRGIDTQLEVEVRDTGPGIPPEKVATIFDPFVQARRGPDGTGLGLSIAERLVGLMGGRIVVESVLGEGSTFRFRLPMTVVDDDGGPVPDEPVDEPAATVLVVEASEARRAHVLRLLQRLGVEGAGCGSGPEAVELVEAQPGTKLVLLAARLPDVDGPDTCTAIRQSLDPRVAGMPVYGMVGGADDDLLDRCRESGMDGHIGKPVDIGELRRLLDVVLGPGAKA